MTDQTTLEPIPQPPGYPVIGNLLDLDTEAPIQALVMLARQYDPIFRLNLPIGHLVVVSGFDLVDELCDDERFDKLIGGQLRNIRAFLGDGLFTSWT
jgi:cytochrome P450 / NADPH-cytochrome P450 reductase